MSGGRTKTSIFFFGYFLSISRLFLYLLYFYFISCLFLVYFLSISFLFHVYIFSPLSPNCREFRQLITTRERGGLFIKYQIKNVEIISLPPSNLPLACILTDQREIPLLPVINFFKYLIFHPPSPPPPPYGSLVFHVKPGQKSEPEHPSNGRAGAARKMPLWFDTPCLIRAAGVV